MSEAESVKTLKKINKGRSALPPPSFPGIFKIVSQDDNRVELCCVNRKVMRHWVMAAVLYYGLLLLFDPRLLGMIDWLYRVQIFFDTAYILGAALPFGAVFYYRLNGEATLDKSKEKGVIEYSYTEFHKRKSGVLPLSMIDAISYFEHAGSNGYLYIICAQNGPVLLVSPPPKYRQPAKVQEYSLSLADWIGCGWNHIGPDGTMVSQLPRRE